MEEFYQVRSEYGYYIFKLKHLLNTTNTSMNKLVRDTNTDFKVIQRLAKGTALRLDIGVLSRMCNYFDCKIEDIVEYVPYK